VSFQLSLWRQKKTGIILCCLQASKVIASVERVFSTMNYVKNKQRNKMGDEYLINCLVTFIEREVFSQVKDEDIINLFQKVNRRVIL
jgi:hypothetical protein